MGALLLIWVCDWRQVWVITRSHDENLVLKTLFSTMHVKHTYSSRPSRVDTLSSTKRKRAPEEVLTTASSNVPTPAPLPPSRKRQKKLTVTSAAVSKKKKKGNPLEILLWWEKIVLKFTFIMVYMHYIYIYTYT